MSSTPSPGPKATAPISRERYHRQYDESGEHVERIEGRVYPMTPSSPQHASVVNRLARRIARQIDDQRIIVRTEQPLQLGEGSDPEPDVALVRGPEARYDASHPKADDVLLVVEVSDTRLRHDRTIKLPLYAAHAIPELWLVNVRAREFEVFRNPLGQERRYAHAATYAAGLLPEPLAVPGLVLRVDEAFPEADKTR